MTTGRSVRAASWMPPKYVLNLLRAITSTSYNGAVERSGTSRDLQEVESERSACPLGEPPPGGLFS